MITMLSNYRTHKVLWSIQAIIAVNMIFLSGEPLIADSDKWLSFDPSAYTSLTEYILRGTGLGTLGFWIRLISTVAGIVFLFAWPRRKFNKKMVTLRSASQLWMFFAFIYVTILAFIFSAFEFYEFFWLQPIVYSLIFGIGYLQTAIEVYRYERSK
jgi:hypothetical protein